MEASPVMNKDKPGIRVTQLAFALLAGFPGLACAAADTAPALAWWVWPLLLFIVCLVLGMIAVPAGIGGGVLFVPIVSGFFPFHLDFVRGAGLLVALSGALAAGPSLLRAGLSDLRLALPLTLVAAIGAIGGAYAGLALPAHVVQVALGITILAVAVIMLRAKRLEHVEVAASDPLAAALRLHGVFHDPATGKDFPWRAHRTPLGLALFGGIGVMAGMFGLGAGWANVPALNVLMGVPLKLSAGTSGYILTIVDSAAAWVYLNQGAVLAMIAAPSVLGMMLGAFVGARLLRTLEAALIRKLVIAILLLSGVRALAKGFGWWA
jgi:uncharacterized membrane protein YfcA